MIKYICIKQNDQRRAVDTDTIDTRHISGRFHLMLVHFVSQYMLTLDHNRRAIG